MDFIAAVSDYRAEIWVRKNAAGKKESYPGISIQSRWEELWKTVSSKDREEESESKDKTPEKDADSQRNIRVLIMTDGYQQIVHREVEISAAGGLRIEKKDGLEETAGNEKLRSQKKIRDFKMERSVYRQLMAER